jgi:phosphoenolpyruvate synthase/pyruvate phosphate dikinase
VIIPSGFVIITNAFHRFICDNRLENELANTPVNLMFQPRTSGVMYTRDPASPMNKDFLGVYAVAGLAEGLVDGSPCI